MIREWRVWARASESDESYSLTVLATSIAEVLLKALANEPCLMSAAIFFTLVVVVVAVAVSVSVVVAVVVVQAATAAAAASAATVAVDGN